MFYGLGSFSFHTGHGGRRHGDWIGVMAEVTVEGGAGTGAGFRFVRHNDANETVLCSLAGEGATYDRIAARAADYGTRIEAEGDLVRLVLNRQ